MSNININSIVQNFSDLVIIYFIILLSLSLTTHASTMHATCGTDVELTCPINSLKKSDEVISWFQPNSSRSQLTFIAIGDILFPEYASIGRYNLISSPANSRLVISNVLTEDQGIYICKSSSSGQHSIKLLVNSYPHVSPPSPLLLYPVNRTFSITCSLLCDSNVDLTKLNWFVNGEYLNADNHEYHLETISSNTQRLTVHLKKKNKNFLHGNYTCEYNGKETSVFVRRRTKEELHRLPRQPGSSSQYLLQSVYDHGQKQNIQFISTILSLLFLFIVQ